MAVPSLKTSLSLKNFFNYRQVSSGAWRRQERAGLVIGGAFTGRVAAGTGVAEEQDEGEGQGEDRGDEEVAAEVADKEGRVYSERLDKEAADGVQAHVEQEYIAVLE